MAKSCEFTVIKDQVTFNTRTNGDHVKMDGMQIPPDEAANLAWMIQTGNDLSVEIKEKE